MYPKDYIPRLKNNTDDVIIFIYNYINEWYIGDENTWHGETVVNDTTIYELTKNIINNIDTWDNYVSQFDKKVIYFYKLELPNVMIYIGNIQTADLFKL